jgi:transcriptional regulator EpsA
MRRRGANGTSPRARFEPTWEESANLVRIVSEAAVVSGHCELDRWLNGELQDFLPHDLLVAAWGDFAQGSLSFDIASRLIGPRARQLACGRIDDFVQPLYGQWVDADREPVVLDASKLPACACGCPLHAALHAMQSGLVHGVPDKRAGYDSVYIALSSRRSMQQGSERFYSIIDGLIAQVDVAFRRVPEFDAEATGQQQAAPAGSVKLSPREHQILERLCRGETNSRIAAALDISPFTVSNHVQRIFRKIGVNNRTQAAARYHELLRSSGG